MKLMSTGKDPLAVDPRTKGTPKPSSDGSSNDNAPQFDGVLSDVGSSGAKAAASADGPKIAEPTSTTLPASDASGSDNTILDALIDILGKGVGTAATQGVTSAGGDAKPAKSDPGTEGSDGVDSLLKKLAAKDSDTTDAQASANGAAAAPSGTPADIMSILLLGAAVQQVPQAAQGGAGAPVTAQAAATLGGLDPRVRPLPTEPTVSTDAKDMIVTDIAVSTHLAPARTAPGKALLASGAATAPTDDIETGPSGELKTMTLGDAKPAMPADAKPAVSADAKPAVSVDAKPAMSADAKPAVSADAKPAVSVGAQPAMPGDAKPAMLAGGGGQSVAAAAATSAASPAHGHADNADTSGHQVEAPVSTDAISTAAMGASLAPVRSIAAAIGELAAPAAPAAATPEAPKAAIGIARTMTLQMNPANLGTVDIRLHVTGQTLDVQLTISDSQTLGIVNRDRDALTSALHDQNYALNSLVIQDGGAAASSGGNNGTQSDSSGSNARADRQAGGGAGSDMQGGGRQGSGADRPARDDRRPTRDTTARAPAASESRAGSLYV